MQGVHTEEKYLEISPQRTAPSIATYPSVTIGENAAFSNSL